MTSETLEEYLADEYHQAMGDIRELEEALERTANLFIYAQQEDGVWPYSYLRSDDPGADQHPSHGTQAMIAVALARTVGGGRLASRRPARLKLKVEDDARTALHLGLTRLGDAVSDGLVSRSFGKDDPITLSHVADLLNAWCDPDLSALQIHAGVEDAVTELWEVGNFDPRATALLRKLPSVASLFEGEPATNDPQKKPELLQNAFVPLRIARSVKALSELERRPPPQDFEINYRRFFEAYLHEQLSFSEIPDSRFDPAELIFCLEGLMLIAPNAVDDRLFERVLNVLEAKQDESAHWRPNRPIYATRQGMTMLPVSVEGAVSLMRSITMRDGDKDFQPLGVRAVPMARRFWKWLQARAVRFEKSFENVAAANKTVRDEAGIRSDFKSGTRQVTGWHSEHVNDPELVHLWDTSQVAEFMLAYRELLQRAVAGRTLQLSGLKVNRSAGRRPDQPAHKWDEIVGKFEPQLRVDEKDQVYRKIKTAFIEPWSENRESKASSMLLYGPPGTGKSTVGENIADALGMRMVTVTVSDFLGRGGAYVEARAKAIFQTLEAQFDTLILFDEIDAFLLDRDSARYDKQDTLFQFLTPGMLTKINDLHKLGRSIFIIATNYKNRIDPAIQRKGRIDQHYLLGLPDKKRRETILKMEMGLKDKGTVSAALVEKTLFYGYPDINAAVADAGGKGSGEGAVKEELDQIERRPRIIASYLGRIADRKDEQRDWTDFPQSEFNGLFQLWKELHTGGTLRAMLEEFAESDPRATDSVFLEELTNQLEGKQNA